jgi:hypothetical protein
MSCKVCQSSSQRTFRAEINIHFPGFAGLTKPTVWAFPSLVICSDCGFAEFVLGDAERGKLRDSDSCDDRQDAAS